MSDWNLPDISALLKEEIDQQILAEVVLNYCELCGRGIDTMSCVPQGAFAAMKVRQNQEKILAKCSQFEEKEDKFFEKYNTELTPMKYSSKLMNSIWGMYNRYSVHNFKKNIDDNVFMFGQQM